MKEDVHGPSPCEKGKVGESVDFIRHKSPKFKFGTNKRNAFTDETAALNCSPGP